MEKSTYLLLGICLAILGLILCLSMSYCMLIGLGLLALAGIFFFLWLITPEEIPGKGVSEYYLHQHIWERISATECKVYAIEQKIEMINAKLDALLAEKEKKAEEAKEKAIAHEVQIPAPMPQAEEISQLPGLEVAPLPSTQPMPEMKVKKEVVVVGEEKREARVEKERVEEGLPQVEKKLVQEKPSEREKPIFGRFLERFEEEKRKITTWEVYFGRRAQIAGGILLTIALILLGLYAALEMTSIQKTFTVLAVGIGIVCAGEIIARKTRFVRYGETLVLSGFMNIYVFPIVGIYYHVFQIAEVSLILSLIVAANYAFAFVHKNQMIFAESILASYIMCPTVFNFLSLNAYTISLPITIAISSFLTYHFKKPAMFLFQVGASTIFLALAGAMIGALAVGTFISSLLSGLFLLRFLPARFNLSRKYEMREKEIMLLWYLFYLIYLLMPYLMFLSSSSSNLIANPYLKDLIPQLSLGIFIFLSAMFSRRKKDLPILIYIALLAMLPFSIFLSFGFLPAILLIATAWLSLFAEKKVQFLLAIYLGGAVLALNCVLKTQNFALLQIYGTYAFNFLLTLFLAYLVARRKAEQDLTPYFATSALGLFLTGLISIPLPLSPTLFLLFLALLLWLYLLPEFFGYFKTGVWVKTSVIYGVFVLNTLFAYLGYTLHLRALFPLLIFAFFTMATVFAIKERVSIAFLEDLPAVKHIPVFGLASLGLCYTHYLNSWLPYLALCAGMIGYLVIARDFNQGYSALDIISILSLLCVARFFLSPSDIAFEIFLLGTSILLIWIEFRERGKTADAWDENFLEGKAFLLLLFSLLTATQMHLGGVLIALVLALFSAKEDYKFAYTASISLLGFFLLHALSPISISEAILPAFASALFLSLPIVFSGLLKRRAEIYLHIPVLVFAATIFALNSFASGVALLLWVIAVVQGIKYVRWKEGCTLSEVVLLLLCLLLAKIAIETMKASISGYEEYKTIATLFFESLCLSASIILVIGARAAMYSKKIEDLVFRYSPHLTAGMLILPLLDVNNILPVIILPLCIAVASARLKDFLNYMFGYLLFSFIIYYQLQRVASSLGNVETFETVAKIVLLFMSVLPLTLADVSRTYMRSKTMMNVNILVGNLMFLLATLFLFGYSTYTTIAWFIFGGCVIGSGVLLHSLFTRLLGIMFILGAISKILLYDLISAGVEPLTRIVAFLIASIVLFLLSYLYTRYGPKLLKFAK